MSKQILKTKKMTRKKKSTVVTIGNSIPLDLIIEILLKLPAKSVLRFRYVSKSWCSIIHSKQFIDAFMSLSLSRPRLVFILDNCYEDRVLSLSSSSVLLAKENFLTTPKFKSIVDCICNSVRGFLCCRLLEDAFVVCNPTTGQVIDLGRKDCEYYYCCMYLGYDPNNDQYKVLRLRFRKSLDSYIEQSVCTLGGSQQSFPSWRSIKTNLPYSNCYEGGVCIDGVVYYKWWNIQNDDTRVLSSFDVGSEQLHDIDTPQDLDLSGELTNYLGKLAVYSFLGDGCTILWVLDDAKNQDWSKKTYVIPCFTDLALLCFRFAGITTAGEIVYVPWGFSDPYELLCYDVEKKEKRVRIEEAIKCLYCPLLCSYVDNIIYL